MLQLGAEFETENSAIRHSRNGAERMDGEGIIVLSCCTLTMEY